MAGFSRFANRDGSCQFGHLLDEWPVSQVGIHFGAHTDRTLFNPSSMLIKRGVLRKRSMWIGEIGGEICVEGRLIVFDGENGFATQGIHAPHEILLRVQSVCGEDASIDRQAGQEGLCDWDFIRLLGNGNLQQCFLAVMCAKGEQMGSRMFVRSSPTNRLAI
ncbi:hypothetical protein Krac_1689 [Ktedonobacter racemifer DSM 44963]|uniref:Uncharacterized protein n=1 Tax=Ktedonobacter racemifer DSM 44963 TaxID=485913 RepID=D6U2R0_KTERA|nr:hypothetical protein Krac_1689 [Ktedonobacter racemifer DSM 44963]